MESSNRTSPSRTGGNPRDLRPLPPGSHLNRPLPSSPAHPPPPDSPLNRPLPPSLSLSFPPPPPPPPPRPHPRPPLSRQSPLLQLSARERPTYWRSRPTSPHFTLNSVNRYQALSLLDDDEDVPSASDSTAGRCVDNNDGQNRGEDAAVRQHSSNDDNDDDENPLLTDSYGKLTTWRLRDLEAAFEKHLEDEASKPKVEVKKKSKEEILKLDDDRKKQFMKYALQKYNNEEDLAEEMRFVFDEIKGEVYVIEDGLKFYEHFNFTAKQAGSMVLFFAEVVPSGDTCDVLCCKPLDGYDNGRCLSCENQSYVKMRHPADEALYVGGHEECQFPFILESSSEDDSD